MDSKKMPQQGPQYLHINPNFRPQNVFVNPRFITPSLSGSHTWLPPKNETHNEFAAPYVQPLYGRYRNVPSKYSWKGNYTQKGLGNPVDPNIGTLMERLKKVNEIEPSGSKLPKKVENKRANDTKFTQTNPSKFVSHSTKDTTFKWKRKPDANIIAAPPKKSSTYSWSRRNSAEKIIKPISPVPCKSPHRVRRNSQMIVSRSGKKMIRKNLLKSAKRTVSQFVSKHKISKVSKFKLDNRPDSQRSARKRTRASFERLFPRFNCENFGKFKLYKKRTKYTNKTLVNIGGILYTATKSKLTRSTPDCSSKRDQVANHHTTRIRVGGERFVLTNNGNTLRRVSSGLSQLSQQRVHFGGVTYESTSDDTLVRTNSHRARHLVTTARHRSIACLNAQKRKINTPCLVYRRIGRCARQESGMCPYTHDRNNVDICKRFLFGTCTASPCLLSHDAGLNKLPTCKFFLEGTCGRESCPYLHVKVSDSAEICREFLQGFCPKGDQCTLRHFNICPEFEKAGHCPKGEKCPYPHPPAKKNLKCKRSLKFTSAPAKKQARARKRSAAGQSKSGQEADGKPIRYYGGEEKDGDEILVLPKRQRLAKMPSYISLELSQNVEH